MQSQKSPQMQIALFQDKKIRKTFHSNEWWFVIEDVILALIDSNDPKQYIQRIKQRDSELAKGWVQIVHTLEIQTSGGKQKMLCGNTKGLLRIIQSIPSQKAEPFKQWLAKVGYERIKEIADPELAMKRTKDLYKAKGYSEDWIEKRMRGIAIRDELTQEWKERGVKEGIEYAILTSEISKATFGITPKEYKKLKNLTNENLRDHMNDLELIFNMLGEKVTTEISKKEKPDSFDGNKKVAKRGGNIAGNARKETENELKESIVSKNNYLQSKKVVEKEKD